MLGLRVAACEIVFPSRLAPTSPACSVPQVVDLLLASPVDLREKFFAAESVERLGFDMDEGARNRTLFARSLLHEEPGLLLNQLYFGLGANIAASTVASTLS